MDVKGLPLNLGSSGLMGAASSLVLACQAVVASVW